MISDYQLQQEVEDELEFEPQVDAAHIGVFAKDGVVTLTGFVATYAEKSAAETAARRVKGVRAIAEEIEVRLPSDKKRADDEIAARALHILEWDNLVPAERIAVRVEKGVLTLSGTVDWQYQKEEAAYDIRKLSGIRGVVNHLRVGSPKTVTRVRETIEKALERSARVEADRISIEADGGAVVLKGKVRDWHERDLVEWAAWSVPGVTMVEDRLSLEP